MVHETKNFMLGLLHLLQNNKQQANHQGGPARFNETLAFDGYCFEYKALMTKVFFT